MFTLQSNDSTPKGLSLNENDIAWSSDFDKFKQPDGFQKVVVTSRTTTCASVGLPSTCQFFNDSGTAYLYQYPNEDENLYLYEMYPNIISPIQGVQDEHFMVWMRTAALPSFRKLYGKIDADLKSGNQLVFTVLANFEVDTFAGTKSLVISTVNEFGGRNPYIGIAYITVGCISLLFALLFVSKQAISPRKIADSALLNWN